MRISLKKFAKEPYKIIRQAPVIILLGKKPTFAVISYEKYKEITPSIKAGRPRMIKQDKKIIYKCGFLYRLFLE